MKVTVLSILIALVLSGCVTKTVVTSVNVPPGAGLAVGKLKIWYNGDDVTSKIFFDVKSSAGTSFRIDQDEAGTFIAQLPVGSYELSAMLFQKLFLGNFGYTFEPKRGVFEIAQSGKIYDLGEIWIDWKGPGVKMGLYLGLAGGVGDIARGNGELTIVVRDDSAAASAALWRRFGSRPPMERTPLKVTELLPARPSSQPQASAGKPTSPSSAPARTEPDRIRGAEGSSGGGPVPVLRPPQP